MNSQVKHFEPIWGDKSSLGAASVPSNQSLNKPTTSTSCTSSVSETAKSTTVPSASVSVVASTSSLATSSTLSVPQHNHDLRSPNRRPSPLPPIVSSVTENDITDSKTDTVDTSSHSKLRPLSMSDDEDDDVDEDVDAEEVEEEEEVEDDEIEDEEMEEEDENDADYVVECDDATSSDEQEEEESTSARTIGFTPSLKNLSSSVVKRGAPTAVAGTVSEPKKAKTTPIPTCSPNLVDVTGMENSSLTLNSVRCVIRL